MKTPAIFEPATRPNSRAGNRIHAAASWWTWSGSFRDTLSGWLDSARRAGYRPRTARIPRLERYDYTFSALHCEAGRSTARQLQPWAATLQKVKLGSQIMLLRDLLLPGMSSEDIRLLFTALRDALTPDTRRTNGALYAPLGDTGGAPTEFPLHCDLYVPKRLWNVFDDVPATGRSGSSIFLPSSRMLSLAVECGVPSQPVSLLKRCLRNNTGDRYDEFSELLYGEGESFVMLDRRMRSEAFRIRFHRGEGYMIDDRVWMHGRTLTSRSVTRNRLHRLVF